jgi:hypothetical protein
LGAEIKRPCGGKRWLTPVQERGVEEGVAALLEARHQVREAAVAQRRHGQRLGQAAEGLG